MDLTLFKSPYHNCRHLVQSAMLKRLGLPLDQFWVQAALWYKETPKRLFFIPYYHAFADHLFTNFGVRIQKYHTTNIEEMLDRVKQLLKEGFTVGIENDIFELPYCSYYQDEHDKHEIEIVDCVDDQFYVCDHFYYYAGTLTADALVKSLESYQQYFGPELTIYYMEKSQEVDLPNVRLDPKQVVENNYRAMRGDLIFNLKDHADDAFIPGLAAIEKARETVDSYLEMEIHEGRPLLDTFFKYLREVSDSRHHFQVFLRSHGVEELADKIHEASQCWMVAANMSLRAYVTGDFKGLQPRIQNRFDRVAEMEAANLEAMKLFLTQNGVGGLT